ncbi:MAG: dephospho-CoA kinase [Betaproteobacteria bacterium]|nr:dephospho-CoA kinase [Betaproteobacteria bacterium]MSQ88399.1 dephospho-CoA kinase [Betaproteobacteria bacterium]
MDLVIGLTGGIGSGKSAVADAFARFGITVVDTDAIAHELTGPDGAAIPEVKRQFGGALVDASGAMNRERMRDLVFSDRQQRARLEALLHPMIRDESARRIAAAFASRSGPYVMHVVPLLIESADYRQRVGRVLVVDCPEELQIARVRQRSGLPESEVRRIIASQIQREKRLAAADDVIDNSGPIAAMQQQVRQLHEIYLRLAAA